MDQQKSCRDYLLHLYLWSFFPIWKVEVLQFTWSMKSCVFYFSKSVGSLLHICWVYAAICVEYMLWSMLWSVVIIFMLKTAWILRGGKLLELQLFGPLLRLPILLTTYVLCHCIIFKTWSWNINIVTHLGRDCRPERLLFSYFSLSLL